MRNAAATYHSITHKHVRTERSSKGRQRAQLRQFQPSGIARASTRIISIPSRDGPDALIDAMKEDGQAYVRQASHAGSWYSKDGATLAGQLDGWLEAARAEQADAAAESGAPVRAIIAPHAGYRYNRGEK